MTKVVLLKLAFLGFYKVIKQGVLLIQDFPSALVLYFGQYLQGYLSMFTAGSRSSLLGCAWLCLVMVGLCLVVLGCGQQVPRSQGLFYSSWFPRRLQGYPSRQTFQDDKGCSTQVGFSRFLQGDQARRTADSRLSSALVLYFGQYLQGYLPCLLLALDRLFLVAGLVMLGYAWFAWLWSSKFHDHKVCSTQAGSLGVFKAIHQDKHFKMTKVVLLKLAFLGFYKVIKQGVLLIQDFPLRLCSTLVSICKAIYPCLLLALDRLFLVALGYAWLCLLCLAVLGYAWLCLVVVSKFHDHKVCSTQAGSLGASRLSIKHTDTSKLSLSDNALFSPYLQGLLYKYHWTFKTGFPSSGSLWPSKVFVQGFNRSSWCAFPSLSLLVSA
ncbi:uncharacterized protein B0P05DRAFT_641738 [Gilbertella persicaria]|uniref:uncharacterized protein n=1 Tax=Gilbertella persicaria TaxID=101096 RepID=UPI0022210B10|nr:uncharacterized protein B0P05DRAFT_641738 [Gilbertella persicaria]KAI8050676.1 hypothetical protein B0P05DRAFT_641738 [Gilbertella persicaria]